MKTLLIIDVQNDFLPGGALPVTGGDEIIPIINQLQPHFALVIATKDWHPINHISFAKCHGKTSGDVISVKGKMQELWPEHCVQNSWGAEFPSMLDTTKIAKTFYKGDDPDKDSYSGVTEELQAFLKTRKVDEVFVVGLATDFCVRHTVLDACRLGYKVTVVKDGCKGINETKKIEEEMKQAGAHLISSKEITG